MKWSVRSYVYVLADSFSSYSIGGKVSVTLEDFLVFVTGTNRIPPTGFHLGLTLNFNNTHVYPSASTCALTLTLPTKYYDNYSLFKEKILYGLENHGGFGLC